MKITIKTATKHLKQMLTRPYHDTRYAEIGDEDFLVTNKDIFGDDEEHYVSFIFLDGYAIGHSFDETFGLMKTLEMTYPCAKDLTKAQKEEIQWYDGIEAPRSYTFRDIALCFGKVKEIAA